MEYVIEDIIKRLTNAQKRGQKTITKDELIQVATPHINKIDETIKAIDRAIYAISKNKAGDWLVRHASIKEVVKNANISRQTLYRWQKKGIVNIESGEIDLIELKKNMQNIREIQNNVTN